MVRSFRDLVVWKKSIETAVSVYRLTQKFPKEETYGLTSQMRRAAVSIPSNIAEGHGRLSTGEYRQFLGVARGSNFELQTQIEIVRALGLGDSKQLDETEQTIAPSWKDDFRSFGGYQGLDFSGSVFL